jgi:hypothetical protein
MNKVDVTHILVIEYPHKLYKGLHRDKLDAMFDWCVANADLAWEYIFPESRFSPQEHFFNFKDGGVATMFALKFN